MAKASLGCGLFAFLNLLVFAYGLGANQSWLMENTNGLWLLLPFFAFSFGCAAIVMGIAGSRRAKRQSDQTSVWWAQAGLVAGAVTIGAMIICAMFAAAVITIFMLANPEG